MIRRRPLFAVAVMILAGLACNSSTDYGSGGGGNTPVADVLIVPGANTKGALAFDPNPFTVSLAGGASVSVKWGNADNITHSVTADGASPLFTLDLNKGTTSSFAFTTAGNYTYHCRFHAAMVGTIQVMP